MRKSLQIRILYLFIASGEKNFSFTNKHSYPRFAIKFKYHIKSMCPLMAQVWQKHLSTKISHYTRQRVINDVTREALVTNIYERGGYFLIILVFVILICVLFDSLLGKSQ